MSVLPLLLLLGFEINDATMSPEGRTELRGGKEKEHGDDLLIIHPMTPPRL